ncbi:MAG: GTPase ObgE [Prevotella sp.]|nr:GTPase ObgE [Staphylococcus sp.]MCM1349650.1 GTPase ObgE [Prevotella sp.]
MFVDSVKIYVKAGDGGNGAVAFLHEKYMAMGGPAGGNGGKGGSVIFVGEEGLTTLLDFRFTKKIKAERGQDGMNKNMFGKAGTNTYVKVPIGTTIIDSDTHIVIGDITKHGQEVVVAAGGKGGKGNAAFANSRNPAPEISEKGQPGVERNLQLELKVLADVGLVGFPSVGKSTLISVVSKAKPKIAAYHFTTLHPHLGVVGVGDGRSFIMADLPGLIEGASSGAGLGIQFLKHIERTRVIVHMIDMSRTDGRIPAEDYRNIRNELGAFNSDLLKRPEIVVANKMDVSGASENLEIFKKETGLTDVIAISAFTKENVQQLLYRIADALDEAKKTISLEEMTEEIVEYNFVPKGPEFTIYQDQEGVFHIEGPAIRRLFDRTNFDNEANVRLFAKKLRDLGVDNELRRLGVEDGDTVCIFDYVFEFIN